MYRLSFLLVFLFIYLPMFIAKKAYLYYML